MPEKFVNLTGLYPRPEGFDGKHNGTAEGDRPGEVLNDTTVSPAYLVPWESYGHLSSADDDIIDAVWGMPDGRRNIRQLKTMPDIGQKK